jgi:predicted MPP superfamily phosphohydrolase
MGRGDKLLLGAVAVGVAAAIADAVWVERYFVKVRRHAIGDLKEGKKKVSLLLLTDLHFRATTQRLQNLAYTVNSIQPDLILIAGDILDEHTQEITPLKDFFQLIDKRIPKVAILGNHDHKSIVDLGDYYDAFSEINCHLLVNKTKEFDVRGNTITVTGLDDFIESRGDIVKATEGVGRKKHHFLLLHSPLQQEGVIEQLKKINEGRDERERLNISYIFAGHNHGGQIRLPGLVPYLPKRSGNYVNGWYNNEKPYLYVSKGYGTSLLPARFFARSEITVFDYYI